MKRVAILLCRIVEIAIVLASMLICIEYVLSGHDNLEFGMERITDITGYVLDHEHTDLILHQTNPCDSIVMVNDTRPIETIRDQMEKLATGDVRWKSVQIPEAEAYEVIASSFSNSYQTDLHFRTVCEIGGGDYDYLFYEEGKGSISGCLVDIDTGTIALYIYLP